MSVLVWILKILALVFFLIAAFSGFGRENAGWTRANFIGLGLAFWLGAEMLETARI
jgi:hypothetical protein